MAVCDVARADVADDLCMAFHAPIMHNALSDSKRLLRYGRKYVVQMDTPNERLRFARQQSGFETAVEAADAMGIARSTYIGHENGHRGFPAKQAPIYARRFKVSEEWLLFGKGEMQPAPESFEAQVFSMLGKIAEDQRPHAIRVLKTFVEEKRG